MTDADALQSIRIAKTGSQHAKQQSVPLRTLWGDVALDDLSI